MKRKLAAIMAGCLMLGLTACGGSTDASGTADTTAASASDTGKTYAVEAGSAG